MPYIYQNKASKNIKTLITNFMNNFHVGNGCCSYKAFDQNAKSRGGFNVTKPFFSNSAKRC